MAYTAIGRSETAWASKTYEEIKEVGARDGSVVVFPVGSIEQHGHHMPVATDIICADAIARESADAVADELPVLVAPPMWAGFSPHHINLGGTLTVDFETIHRTLENIADSAIDNGFDAVLFFNGHGGNGSAIGAAVKTVGSKHHPDVDVLGLTYFGLAEPFIDDIRDSDVGGMNHGGELETSLMMHLRPELVHEDKMDALYLDEPYTHAYDGMYDRGPLSVYRSEEEYSPSGAVGDPGVATPEKGEAIFDGLCGELRTMLREIHEQNSSGD